MNLARERDLNLKGLFEGEGGQTRNASMGALDSTRYQGPWHRPGVSGDIQDRTKCPTGAANAVAFLDRPGV